MPALNMEVIAVDPLGSDPLALLRQAAIEARQLYPELFNPDSPWPTNAPVAARGVFLVAYAEGVPVAMGSHQPVDAHATELRRMFTVIGYRRLGAGRFILKELEAHARAQGFRKLKLETGYRQVAAMRLYESMGFMRTRPFGTYVNDPTSVCYSKPL